MFDRARYLERYLKTDLAVNMVMAFFCYLVYNELNNYKCIEIQKKKL